MVSGLSEREYKRVNLPNRPVIDGGFVGTSIDDGPLFLPSTAFALWSVVEDWTTLADLITLLRAIYPSVESSLLASTVEELAIKLVAKGILHER